MAIQALNSAATGLRALSTRIDVLANNLANAETTAFKRSRAHFEDLIYVTQRQPGAQNNRGEVSPAGIQVGLGVKIASTQIDLEQGAMESTGNELDIAINGEGFFQVQIDPNQGEGIAYTRNGNFFVNPDGELVINIGDGLRLQPPVGGIPNDYEKISISRDGRVEVILPGALAPQQVGQLELFRFPNSHGLKNLGSSLYMETTASGPPTGGNPGEGGTGQLQQGYLEGSNVDPVKELVTLIKTQRSFELNSQSIQTADQALQTIANLRRF
jgi:flagellar basal-body rod protein FlgG